MKLEGLHFLDSEVIQRSYVDSRMQSNKAVYMKLWRKMALPKMGGAEMKLPATKWNECDEFDLFNVAGHSHLLRSATVNKCSKPVTHHQSRRRSTRIVDILDADSPNAIPMVGQSCAWLEEIPVARCRVMRS